MTMMYNDLLPMKGKGTPYDKLQQLAAKSIVGAPEDYMSFLFTIGFGEFGDGQFMLYSALVSADEIYGKSEDYLQQILLLGDDFQGFNVGYDSQTWEVIEIDSTDMSIRVIALTFQEFIRSKIRELT